MRNEPAAAPNVLVAMLLAGMAGGMGWGIRGQYGHQTGAMIAGVLVGVVLTLLFARRLTSLSGARAAAFLTLGVAVGGSMTYGQTIGLTQDAPLIGNWEALRWGLLGLFLKGGIWIALAGLLFGMSLGRVRYRTGELAMMVTAAIFARFLGIALLNEPYHPDEQQLPAIYFSDDWYWEPAAELSPRRELWGGLLLAVVALAWYVRGVRHDRLAFRLALVGFVAGGLGFAGGQCLQAAHAWNPQWFAQGWFASVAPHINWWNMMEITFGAVFASGLALGLWCNRGLIRHEFDAVGDADSCTWSSLQELLLAVVHVAAVIVWSFGDEAALGAFAGMAYPMILIPLVGSAAGRWWPYLVLLPVVIIPIAGKTLKHALGEALEWNALSAWLGLVVLPVTIALAAAAFFARRALVDTSGQFASRALPLLAWMYFGLNYSFFEFPWPWQAWTGRTPSGLIFAVCATGLTLGAIYYGRTCQRPRAVSNVEPN